MTTNYRNSAGTDLDNLFLVTNSNAGAIGFVSGGQDLGNRYPTGSLGYNVGYKSSAGTDIGYLRSNRPPYTHAMTVRFLRISIGGIAYLDQYGYNANHNAGSLTPNTVGSYYIDYFIAAVSDKKITFHITSKVSIGLSINIDDKYTISGSTTTDNYGASLAVVREDVYNYFASKDGQTIYLNINLT